MATDFAVKVVAITDVLVHPNADRLELAQIAGWQCVVQKGAYKAGDLAVYIPIDSILPNAVETTLFGADSKIKLSKSRVRTIKLRGAISQGMLAPCSELGVPEKEGYDCTSKLGITKYEPPQAPASMQGGLQVSKKKLNPLFKKYGGLDNYKNYPELFAEGEEVIITEKIHGTNFRFGYIPSFANTPWKKIKKFFGLLPEFEFVFGSNNVQQQERKPQPNGFYEQSGVGNVYQEAVAKYNLKEMSKERPGLIFFGEIYGDGIQANYKYGCEPNEHKFVGFDIWNVKEEKFLDHFPAKALFRYMGLDVVPELYQGSYNSKIAKDLTIGNSVLAPTQKIREGVVIKPRLEEKCHMGRKVLKLLSDEYLLKDDNTDFH